MQQLAGLADALNGITTDQLANVLPLFAGLDEMIAKVRAAGVPVQLVYPKADSLPIDPTLLTGPLGGAILIRDN